MEPVLRVASSYCQVCGSTALTYIKKNQFGGGLLRALSSQATPGKGRSRPLTQEVAESLNVGDEEAQRRIDERMTDDNVKVPQEKAEDRRKTKLR